MKKGEIRVEDNNDKITSEKEVYMELCIIKLMLTEVGRYVSFQKLNQYPVEKQYQIVTEIKSYLKEKKKKK